MKERIVKKDRMLMFYLFCNITNWGFIKYIECELKVKVLKGDRYGIMW